VRLLAIPQPYLYGGILLFSSLGAYSLNGSAFDLILLWVIGLIGYLMRRFDFPVAPCVIGLILGPLAEEQMRRALSISQGDASVFFTHPLSATLLAIAAVALVGPMLWRLRRRPAAT
jgi:putative tricarboxylic transport membrane protein